MPLVAETAAEGVAWALRIVGGARPPGQARILRIRNTRRLDTVYASPAVLAELRARPEIEVTAEAIELVDGGGELPAAAYA